MVFIASLSWTTTPRAATMTRITPAISRDDARMLGAAADQHGFHGLAAGLAEQRSELSRGVLAHGVRPEKQTYDASYDQQQRSHRKHGVVGEGRPSRALRCRNHWSTAVLTTVKVIVGC